MPETLHIFTSDFALKAQIFQGMGPFFQIDLLKTGRIAYMLFPRRKPHKRGAAGPLYVCAGARCPGAVGDRNH